MKKRALMLSAAAAALVSGHSNAATLCDAGTSSATNCNVLTQITTPVYTGTVPASGVTNPLSSGGSLTIATNATSGGSNGSVVLSVNPPTAPAITLNSGSSTTPTTVNNQNLISYQGINNAVGVLLEEASVPTSTTATGTAENFTGEFINSSGTINLLGTGTGKNGILIAGGAFPGSGALTAAGTGAYANTGLGVFTGATNIAPASGTTAIDLEQGSILEVQGTNSFGINLIGPAITTTQGVNTTNVPSGGASLIGDIDVAGSIQMTPTTAGSTTALQQNIGIFIGGFLPSTANPTNPAFAGTSAAGCTCAMAGNINIFQGGTVSSIGEGAEGIVVQGGIKGSIINAGLIETAGISTAPSTALNASDPEAGTALAIANNVTGGIFNSGPTVGNANASVGTIEMIGSTAAVVISPSANNEGSLQVPLPVTIGGFTDSAGNTYSLLNRGMITSASENANIPNTAIFMQGTPTAPVTLTDGLFNSGKIQATGTTNVNETAQTAIAAIHISNFVTLGVGQSTAGPTFAIFNTNETSEGGLIEATVSGQQTGKAVAIQIDGSQSGGTPATVPSLFNSGDIEASATTTDLTISNLSAIAIEDGSGSLSNVVNNGTIRAVATILNNNTQSAIAIDLSNNTASSVTVTNQAATTSANIVGDIAFGTHAATLNDSGISSSLVANITGNITFNNEDLAHNDQLNIGTNATVTGEVQEAHSGSVDIKIANTGQLNLLTSLPTNVNSTVPGKVLPNKPLSAGILEVDTGGNLNISLSQGNNVNAFPSGNNVTVINAQNVTLGGDGVTPTLSLSFGSFVGNPSAGNGPSQFVLVSTPSGGSFSISQQEMTLLENTFDSANNPGGGGNTPGGIPFLFTSNICTFNVTIVAAGQACTGTEPYSASNQELVLTLTPKTASQLGLTGFAKQMFGFANQALVNDNTLGAAMVTDITNPQQAQAAYASFAPDVSGATRATAISLTDSASDVVAARQRELRMYSGQEGETTLWGQQFVQRLSQGNNNGLTGYNDSGFGFVVGADEGDPIDGRYGLALTFFSGGMSQKEPTRAKTSSEYYLLTGYTDWRGKGLFVDTQLTAGYANLKGHRYISLTDTSTDTTVSREADGNRPSEMLAGSVTAGGVLTAGGTVLMPQIDVDGLTSREEAYTESGGGQGFNLRVQPYYAESLRAFLGTDIRQDINFGDFFLQPDLRVGYRYDFLKGAQKLKVNFDSVGAANGQSLTQFSVEGPDPGHGNLVLGAGVATTTGSWSIGLSYDYLKSDHGPSQQSGVLTLVGKI